jgi:ferredoxin
MEDPGLPTKGDWNMRVKASTHICIASGTCAMISPDIFTQRDTDGVVHVLDAHPHLTLLNKVREAVTNCPSQALSIEDEDNISEITIEEDDSAL